MALPLKVVYKKTSLFINLCSSFYHLLEAIQRPLIVLLYAFIRFLAYTKKNVQSNPVNTDPKGPRVIA